MKKEVKVWWSELADQFEEWAEKPPSRQYSNEIYTCDALMDSKFGWHWDFGWRVEEDIQTLYGNVYPETAFPIAEVETPDRDSERFDYCWFLAETIREAIGEE